MRSNILWLLDFAFSVIHVKYNSILKDQFLLIIALFIYLQYQHNNCDKQIKLLNNS